MTAPKFHTLRDQLYGLLHDEIRKSMTETAQARRRYDDTAKSADKNADKSTDKSPGGAA
jgi:hypothetical protein